MQLYLRLTRELDIRFHDSATRFLYTAPLFDQRLGFEQLPSPLPLASFRSHLRSTRQQSCRKTPATSFHPTTSDLHRRMTPPHRTEPPEAVAPELEEELSNFRREWIEESKHRKAAPAAPTPRSPPRTAIAELTHESPPAASSSSPTRRKTARRDSSGIEERMEGMLLEEKWKPKAPQTALELYAVAVASEREGRLNDGE